MKKTTTIAGVAALALTLSGAGAAAAQAKAPTRSHATKPSVTRDYGDGGGGPPNYADGSPNILDWLDLGPSESGLPDLGLLTDLLEGL